ncbi:hypothetical protein Tcan_15929 [Toxocara canis]|uniref:Uncharacterized protein n=1 Tax=Toxocara canis TaxID=6265 RepID=A0A0B2VF74_TOXCA|nr:hypothetical protein Tcan_15929 [Toxocara canis]
MEAEETGWCQLSEMRLFKKILEHKPAGISRHFHLSCLTDLMNNVYEDEDTDFEDVLSDDDLRKLELQRDIRDKHSPATFHPKYKIRPTCEQIKMKLDELYNMNAIEENEYTPPEFSTQSDFFLPDGDYSELIRRKEEEVSKEQSFLAPPPTTSRPLPRRKRRDSGETHSSRSSTPASARDLRKS